MKKLLILSIVTCALFNSCRKGYYCHCTNPDGNEITEALPGKMTKSKAQAQCSTFEAVYSSGGFTCTVKEI